MLRVNAQGSLILAAEPRYYKLESPTCDCHPTLPMPLVLVQNERTADRRFEHFDDVTGEQYHFLNRYHTQVVPGTWFVYYRGVRRADGTRRQLPEYFGCGRVGEVWRDARIDEDAPRSTWKWFCNLDEYLPFITPVAARIDGQLVEDIATNLFQVSVRSIADVVFRRILRLGGVNPSFEGNTWTANPELGPVDTIRVCAGEDLWVRRPGLGQPLGGGGRLPSPAGRRSAYAKLFGDRAESVVLRLLGESLNPTSAATLRWVAAAGEKPGWDIEYLDASGRRVAVEVKGTAAPRFEAVDLTQNEWHAAIRLGARYWLYLVAECTTGAPTVQAIQDPARAVSEGRLAAEPATWRISSTGS